VAGQAPQVGIVGLRALNRDIQRAGSLTSPLNSVMSDAGRTAAEPVARETAVSLPRVDTLAHDAGTMADSIRVTASRTGAAVRMGRASIPYAGPLEFGGYPEGREFIATGRYLFPAAGRLANDVAQLYAQAVQRGLDAFPWSNETNNPEAVHE
jgi:hypothetical protein